jgi:hypothetical protein
VNGYDLSKEAQPYTTRLKIAFFESIMTVQNTSQEMGDWNAGEQSKCDSCVLRFGLL